jgi:uncharacterized membrane protein
MRNSSYGDVQMESLLGQLLRVGVLLAGAVVAIGGTVYLCRHGMESPNYGVFHGEPADLRSIGGIVRDTLNFRGRGIVQLGLVMLIATPIARVAFSVYAFARERDYTYVAITLIVFGLLMYSLFAAS